VKRCYRRRVWTNSSHEGGSCCGNASVKSVSGTLGCARVRSNRRPRRAILVRWWSWRVGILQGSWRATEGVRAHGRLVKALPAERRRGSTITKPSCQQFRGEASAAKNCVIRSGSRRRETRFARTGSRRKTVVLCSALQGCFIGDEHQPNTLKGCRSFKDRSKKSQEVEPGERKPKETGFRT
jgi:hypothetical protein